MRQFAIREPSIEALRSAPIYFRYGSNKKRVLVDALTASAVLAIYDALDDPANKAKCERMTAGTPAQFRKLVSFCFARVKIGNRGVQL